MTNTEEQQSSDMVERVAADIVRDVAELPGDTPPDDPEAMIVTCDELSIICERHLTDLLEACHHAELVEALKMVVRGADSRNRSAPYVTNAIRVLAKLGPTP